MIGDVTIVTKSISSHNPSIILLVLMFFSNNNIVTYYFCFGEAVIAIHEREFERWHGKNNRRKLFRGLFSFIFLYT